MKGRYFITIMICLTLSGLSSRLSAQKAMPVSSGIADGVVRDSAHNYVLQSATIALYRVKDSSLVRYQLSSVYGEFHFRGLPVGIPLKIVASFTGYQSLYRVFTIPESKDSVHLEDLNLMRKEDGLPEVVISAIPPVRMNGDTLEFNADAFKLDSNAVVEDLVRKLPGFTVWGDGTITVYGRQVSSVLVEGKPFFGGDARIATQNLPKGVVDKIQVYHQNKNLNNPLDSVTEVNIKLKKDKKDGYFGKLSAGAGTEGHYELDGNINFYSPRTQLAVVGDGNNTNKVASDVNTLLRNSTFKGVGASLEYQPDFTTQGLNRPRAGGFTFQHDFIPDPGWQKNDRLSANYFINSNNTTINSNSQTLTSLPANDYLVQENNNSSRNFNRRQDLSTRYDKQKEKNTYYLSLSLGDNYNEASNSRVSSSRDSVQQLTSNNNIINDLTSHSRTIGFETGYRHRDYYDGYSHSLKDRELDYSFNAGDFSSNQANRTAFTSEADPTQNMLFDRTYDNRSSDVKHHLYLSTGDFTRFLFGYPRLSGVSIYLQNNSDFSKHDANNKVQDRDTATKEYHINGYLSNNSTYYVFNDMPSLSFSRSFVQGLANRYNKSLTIDVKAQAQFFNLKNTSVHSFQNISQQHQRMIPNAGVTYSNNQYGDYQDNYSIGYTSSVDYPMPDQLAPLVDSSNLYYIQEGNIRLQPNYKQEMTFDFKHASFQKKNTFNYNINIKAGTIRNSFADSSISDDLGRTFHYPVNVNGYRYIIPSASVNKAIKYNSNELQIGLSTSFSISSNPSYVNNSLNISHQTSNTSTIDLHYTFGDLFSVRGYQSAAFYHSRQVQKGVVNIFDNSSLTTTFSASLNCTSQLSISSNINYNHTTSTGVNPYDFTIWNASAGYRFLRSHNAEVKFAALDLLRQNKGIQNYGSNNTLTRGTVNVLQQYFMLTFSYYPRKFGLKKGAK